MSSGITRDDWLRAVYDADRAPVADEDDAITVRQLADMLEASVAYANRVGNDLVRQGKAVIVRKRNPSPEGRRYVKAYRLIQP